MRTTLFSSTQGDIRANMAFVNNLGATTNPTTGDDVGDGYEVGSVWINTSTGAIYTCVDKTLAAAVWKLQESSGGVLIGSSLAVTGPTSLNGAVAVSGGSTLTVAPTTLAALGATQGNAALVTSRKVVISASVSTEGVKLPVWATGLEVDLINGGAIPPKVWPNTNAKIAANASNAADATKLAAFKNTIYKAVGTNLWIPFRGA